MARMLRSAVGGSWHHVMNRGARRLPVFGDDADRHAFLALLVDAIDGRDARVHAYALMPNHFHLLVEADVVAMSGVMKSLAGRYAQRFNLKYGYDGPLFRSRYRSKPIEDDRQLAATVRYIHRNPVSDTMIYDEQFRWTSHPAYVAKEALPNWLTTETVLGRFDTRGDFDSFVRGPLKQPPGPPLLDHLASRQPQILNLSDVELALGVESESERDVLRQGGRGVRNDVRLAALHLGTSLTSAPLDELCRRYGYSSPTVARSAMTRAQHRVAHDSAFAELVDHALLRLGRSV